MISQIFVKEMWDVAKSDINYNYHSDNFANVFQYLALI